MSLYLLQEAGALVLGMGSAAGILDSGAGRASAPSFHGRGSGPFDDDQEDDFYGHAGALPDLFRGGGANTPPAAPPHASGTCPPGTVRTGGSLEFPTCAPAPRRSVRIGTVALSTPLAPAPVPTPPLMTRVTPATPPAPSPYIPPAPSIFVPPASVDSPVAAPSPGGGGGGGGGGGDTPTNDWPLLLAGGAVLLLLYFGRKKKKRR